MTILEKKLAIAFLATAMTGAGITMSELAAHAAPNPTPIVEKVAAPRARAAQPDNDVKTYAAREAGAKKQLDYKGGDMVVIGLTTTGVIVLLVVALLLL